MAVQRFKSVSVFIKLSLTIFTELTSLLLSLFHQLWESLRNNLKAKQDKICALDGYLLTIEMKLLMRK